MIEVVGSSLPRFQLYEKLDPDPVLQISLLNVFTHIVKFTIHVMAYLNCNLLSKYFMSITLLPT